MAEHKWCVKCRVRILSVEEMEEGDTCSECKEKTAPEGKDNGAEIST